MLSIHARRLGEIAAGRWWSMLPAGAVVAFLVSTLAAAPPTTDNVAPALDRAHTKLSALMSAHSGSPTEVRSELLAIRRALEPLDVSLRPSHPELARVIDLELDDALAQLEEGDNQLTDRSEFEVSYLLPLAQSLSDAHDASAESAR